MLRTCEADEVLGRLQYQPTKPTISPLPIELWRDIFRLATNIPSQLDVLHDVHLHDADILQAKLRPLYVSSISTKLTLVLVCKSWQLLAIELLYEDIQPSTIGQLSTLGKTLKQRSQDTDAPVGGHEYGWWTKELHVPFVPQTDGMEAISFILAFLPLFPNLSTLIIQGWFEVAAWNSDRLANSLQTWSPKLKYLKCNQWDTDRTEAGSVFFQIHSLQSLRTVWGNSTPGVSLTGFRHATLTSLSLSVDAEGDLPFLTSNTLPSLTSFFLRGGAVQLPGAVRFVEVHGEQLLTLGVVSNGRTTEDGQVSLLEQFLCLCPNLRQLFWGKSHPDLDSDIMVLSSRPYPNIALLGIFYPDQSLKKDDWEGRYPLSRFPNLKRIRLLDMLERRVTRPTTSSADSTEDVVQDLPSGIIVENALGVVIGS